MSPGQGSREAAEVSANSQKISCTMACNGESWGRTTDQMEDYGADDDATMMEEATISYLVEGG
jgi:hypothetical protein